MAMSLFTIEQVELVRRLRLTGITPEQVIEVRLQIMQTHPKVAIRPGLDQWRLLISLDERQSQA